MPAENFEPEQKSAAGARPLGDVGAKAPFPTLYILLLLVWAVAASCLAASGPDAKNHGTQPPVVASQNEAPAADGDDRESPETGAPTATTGTISNKKDSNSAGAGTATPDDTDRPALEAGQIRVEGKVEDVNEGANAIVLNVSSFTLPGGSPTAISPVRRKNVVIGPKTSLHVRGDSSKVVSLPYVVEGDSVIAVGQNLGTGKPLPASEVLIWRDFRDGKYTFEQPSATPAGSKSPGSSPLDTAAAVQALTGTHTRLVWCQTVDIRGKDEGSYRLACLDTDDGRGVRKLLWRLSSCVKPLITPDGEKVVFTNRRNNTVFVVNWDGTGLKRLVDGYAVDVWRDPETHLQWVYARTGAGTMKSSIRRYRLDKPAVSELVWDKTPLDQENYGWFQLSADGKRAAAAFPWPKCGIATLPNGSWRSSGLGCWTSIAPDNSYYNFRFDGTHKHIILSNQDGKDRRVITLSWAPGVFGNPVLYPRWTNNVHYITMTGPSYDRQGQVYIGRFNEDFTAIDQWVRVTDSHISNIWGSAWIKPGKEESDPLALRAASPVGDNASDAEADATPASTEPLKIQVKLMARSPVPTYNEMAPYTRALVVYEYKVEKVVSGKYEFPKIRIAHWAVMRKKPLPVAHATVGETYDLVVQPFTQFPKLESEYMADSLPLDESLPLYYEPRPVESDGDQPAE